MKLLISAGEASGEMYGAQLIEALRRRDPSMEFMGVGGERMRAAGCRAVVDARDVAVVGLGEVVSHLPRIWREFRRLVRAIDEQRPDAAVLIDFPDWNFRLARELHRRNIPVLYYVSPQLWAWRSGRIELVKRYVRKMLVIFPFEVEWYRQRGVEAEFVGHPLADPRALIESREEFARQYHLDTTKQWIALLPGSRRKEFAMNAPAILRASARLQAPAMLRELLHHADRHGAASLDTVEAVIAAEEAMDTEFSDSEVAQARFTPTESFEWVLPVASTLDRGWVEQQVRQFGWVRLVEDAWAALAYARAAVVASGTATMQAAISGTPFVMVYRVSRLTWLLGRRLVNVPHFAMVNLIAGREVVPELVQKDFTSTNITSRLERIIPDGPARERMLAGLAEVREKLRAGSERPAAERAADAVLAAIHG